MKPIEVTLGIKISGTSIEYGLVNRKGEIVFEEAIKMRVHDSAETLFERLHKQFTSSYKNFKDTHKLMGIGIAAPCANYHTGTVENSSNLNWVKVPVVEIAKKYWDVPIVITNDANASAVGELKYGVAKNFKNFIQITLGLGLGSGIVVEGNLLYGNEGFAGEIGHTIIERNGRHCGCGRKGCLETYVSTTGLVRTAIELLSRYNGDSVLREVPLNDLTSELIFKAAKMGDSIASEAFEITGQIFGEALANTVACFSPEAIILTEGLASAGDLIVNSTIASMEKNLLSLFKGKVQILLSGLPQGNAAILGASALIWHELQINKVKFHLRTLENEMA